MSAPRRWAQLDHNRGIESNVELPGRAATRRSDFQPIVAIDHRDHVKTRVVRPAQTIDPDVRDRDLNDRCAREVIRAYVGNQVSETVDIENESVDLVCFSDSRRQAELDDRGHRVPQVVKPAAASQVGSGRRKNVPAMKGVAYLL